MGETPALPTTIEPLSFSMSHDFCRAKLGEFLDQTLDETQRAQVAAHLENCAACAQIARETANIRAALREIAPVEAPATLRQNVRNSLQNERQRERNAPPARPVQRPRFAWRLPQLAWSGTLAVAAVALIVLARPFANAPLTISSPQIAEPSASAPALTAPGASTSDPARASKPKPTSQVASRAKNGAPARSQSPMRSEDSQIAPAASPQSAASAPSERTRARTIVPESALAQQRPNPLNAQSSGTANLRDAANPRDSSRTQASHGSRENEIRPSQLAQRATSSAPRATRSMQDAALARPRVSAPAPAPNSVRSDAARSNAGDSVPPAPQAPPADLSLNASPAPTAPPLLQARIATPQNDAANQAALNPGASSAAGPAAKKAKIRGQQPRPGFRLTPQQPAPTAPKIAPETAFSFELKTAPTPSLEPKPPLRKSAPARIAPQMRARNAAPTAPGAPEIDLLPFASGRSGIAAAGRGNRADLTSPAPPIAAPPDVSGGGRGTISGDFAASNGAATSATTAAMARRFSLQIRAPLPLQNLRVRLEVPPSLRLLWPASALIWSGDLSPSTPLIVPFSLGQARGGEKISVIVEQKLAGARSRVLETQTLVVPAL